MFSWIFFNEVNIKIPIKARPKIRLIHELCIYIIYVCVDILSGVYIFLFNPPPPGGGAKIWPYNMLWKKMIERG